jgi:hypothetical protein
MKEQELAELFNSKLDGLLKDGEAPAFSPDQGAMDLAISLAAADFSAESGIKDALRERLTAGDGAGLLHSLRALLAGPYARAAFAAAILIVALLPLARRHAERVPVVPPQIIAELPPLPSQAVPARLPAPPAAARPAGVLFASVPMGRLETEPIQEFPIAAAGAGLQITLAEGRPITQGTGPGIVLETERVPFPIERRVIKPEDLFERRVL